MIAVDALTQTQPADVSLACLIEIGHIAVAESYEAVQCLLLTRLIEPCRPTTGEEAAKRPVVLSPTRPALRFREIAFSFTPLVLVCAAYSATLVLAVLRLPGAGTTGSGATKRSLIPAEATGPG